MFFFFVKGTGTLSGEATLPYCFTGFSEKVSSLKGNNSLGSKLFLLWQNNDLIYHGVHQFRFLLHLSKLPEDTYDCYNKWPHVQMMWIDHFCFLLHFSKLPEGIYGHDKKTASYMNDVLYDRSFLFSLIF